VAVSLRAAFDSGLGAVRGVLPYAAAAALVVGAAAAQADPAGVVNALRTDGCGGVTALGSPARRDSALDAAARELAGSATLADALGRVGYPVTSSTSFHLRGSREDDVLRRLLAERYCGLINDSKFSEFGVHQSGAETWIVMAGRAAMPFGALQDPAAVERRVLDLVNAARGEARQCGRERYEAAPPLKLSTPLSAAASLHSLDMVARGTLAHEGSDGSVSGDRITRAGYIWQGSGENIAAGQLDAESVVAAWLSSPGHCATLMQPRFTETGVAFALAPQQNPSIYWTQVFATPRSEP
jgi:uncharacterized protein YkwD